MRGEDYRRCCTSVAWVGQALAIRLLQAENYWNHDAFFDYVDRWMYEDDSKAVQTILDNGDRFKPVPIIIDYSVFMGSGLVFCLDMDHQ